MLTHTRFKNLMRKILTSTSLVVSICEYLSRIVKREISDISYEKIITLPDAFDPIILSKNLSDSISLKKKINITNEKFLIAYIGQVWRWKRIEFIIDAVKLIDDNDIVLLILGGPKNELQYLKKYAESKSCNNVIFLDPVPPKDVATYIYASDCLIHYTPSSGLFKSYSPLKIFEYMAAGKPILAPRQPWIEEVLRDGETALLFDENDPRDLAEKIKRIKQDRELAAKIARNAKQESQNYTYEKRAEKLLKTIHPDRA